MRECIVDGNLYIGNPPPSLYWKEEKLPAFMIFPDAVLREICTRRPRTTADLLAISGIGEVKAARYGPAFLEAVRKGK